MKSAPVQNSSSVATLRSSFCSSVNNCVASDSYRNYPERIERSSRLCRDTFWFLFAITATFLLFSPMLNAQNADSTTSGKLFQDTIEKTKTNLEWNRRYLSTQQKTKRQLLIGGLNIAGYGTSIIIFNNQWYRNYPKTSFHTFNDSKEWLQMDKIGHSWAAYNSGLASAAMWRWAGVEDQKAIWIGGLSSTVYLTVIEILDAHSSKWGWSWADMGANVFGSGLLVGQQLAWQEQRIKFKFSFHRREYSDPMLNERSDELFGAAWTERMLKDYNGQTYWLSANLRSFFPKSNLPVWLNVAFGYGGDGMFGGFENKWTNGDPGSPVDRTDIRRYRQWYIAPDIDFSKIETHSKAVRVLFAVLDAFKFPAPALELSNGKVKVNAISF